MSVIEAFAWGHLKDHYSDCDECGGPGADVNDDEDCGCNEGRVRWGSFYEQDRGECESCGETDVVIAAMYEDSYTCLPCWLHDHARRCGCDLWRAAEDHYKVTGGEP
jgi:hypothetical protein